MGRADEGFDAFVETRSTALLRTAYLLCAGDRDAAEDLLQDVLERTYGKWRRINTAPEAYVRAALANAAANRWRHRSRRVREAPLEDGVPPSLPGHEQQVPAVVLLHRVAVDGDAWQGTMLSLVARDAANGQVRLLGVDLPRQQGAPAGAFLFGPGDRTLLAVDQGRPVEFSLGLTVAEDGAVTRERSRLLFSDGVAIRTLPAWAEPVQSVLTLDGDGPLLRPQLAAEHVWHLDLPPHDPSRELPMPRPAAGVNWHGPQGLPFRRSTGQPFLPPNELRAAGQAELAKPRYRDPLGEPQPKRWELLAGLSGNRSLYVTEIADGGPTRIYGVVVRPDGSVETVRYGGPGRLSALPVQLRLPGEEGWLVAQQHAELRWRTGPDVPWQAAGQEVAVLPGNAREVEVTVGGRAERVALG
ncbi:sigma factor [Crossiella sp. CA-258035]|uniref:sigma factor n=1 Tax=Crossiella sp. CA-258035 TaxID=2981138 RepID=UPI0024BC2DDE|nr:sigma factor [Crossiella sp. CA-258035]WHT18301.1 sigma factor [Crossiella sp. CA-258035]